jgi:uncharacterized membrane protein YfcA
MKAPSEKTSQTKLLPWFLWVGLFFAVWLTIVAANHYWHQVAVHWPIALGMAIGSYVAGSTPMGGGTVGFPILVLLFDFPATMGRNFSFCIQSIGMVSAAIFILSSRQKIAWGMLKWAMLSCVVVLPISTLVIAPFISDLSIKLLFAIVWCSFGIMTLVKLNEMCGLHGINRHACNYDLIAGILVGLVGGVVASITGVGIDMVIYAVLVLMWRTDLKMAVPTSVILMAFASVVGTVTHLFLGTLDSDVFFNWLAAAPVVCLGAPLGAFIVNLIDRKPTLVFVSFLCIGQFIWTAFEEKLGLAQIGLGVGGVLIFQAAFHFMYMAGKRIKAKVGKAETPEEAHIPLNAFSQTGGPVLHATSLDGESPRVAP